MRQIGGTAHHFRQQRRKRFNRILRGLAAGDHRAVLLQLGDEEAHYLGVNVRALQRWLLLCSAVLVAVAVAISGVIGFIGLVVPHLMRLWLGPDHRGLIPGSLLAGAILLLLADTLARTVAAPAEMPVGLLTSLLGAPWFLWLVFRRENSRHG